MSHDLDLARQAALVDALTDPARYSHPVTEVTRLETHISHILLAGEYAYKIKKPLNLGFLDFTGLSRRRFCCEEEVRLNRRLAPDLYLDCIPICGTVDNPILGGEPAGALEFAVKMRRFPQSALLDRGLADGRLQPAHIAALAHQLVAFHAAAARAGADRPFGTPAHVHQPVAENFLQMRPLLAAPADHDRLNRLENWTISTYNRLQPLLAARKAAGFVRECHGDLHLGNMILQGDEILIFDCIEFNPDLIWTDVMSDIGFLTMDLYHRQAPDFAQSLLNAYLEFSGDYTGLEVLPYYQVYRALVRAKIAAIRHGQPDLDAARRAAVADDCRAYLDLALQLTRPPAPFLLITHGLSGSGKSWWSHRIAAALGGIRLRSDVERKRLFGLDPLAASGSGLNQGLYTPEAGRRTYARLCELAEHILEAGYPVLVDATFPDPAQRHVFRDLAGRCRVPFILLQCTAPPALLRERVAARKARGDDAAEADLAVLDKQLQHHVPPGPEERPLVAGPDHSAEAVIAALRNRLAAAATIA